MKRSVLFLLASLFAVSAQANNQMNIKINDAASLNRQIADFRANPTATNTTLAIARGEVKALPQVGVDITYCMFFDMGVHTLSNGMELMMEAGLNENGDFIAITSDQSLVFACSMVRQSRAGYQLQEMDIKAALGTMAEITIIQ